MRERRRWAAHTIAIAMASGFDQLPHVDEHSTTIAASAEASWEALLRMVESLGSGQAPRFARLLGCADVAAAGPRPLAPGSAVTGFHVEQIAPLRELALVGSHRFSAYALVFRLDRVDAGETRLRAETRAEFPGLKGRAYRALVIGSRGHVLATRRLLGAVKRRAERG